jgi:hypothetical protein
MSMELCKACKNDADALLLTSKKNNLEKNLVLLLTINNEFEKNL